MAAMHQCSRTKTLEGDNLTTACTIGADGFRYTVWLVLKILMPIDKLTTVHARSCDRPLTVSAFNTFLFVPALRTKVLASRLVLTLFLSDAHPGEILQRHAARRG